MNRDKIPEDLTSLNKSLFKIAGRRAVEMIKNASFTVVGPNGREPDVLHVDVDIEENPDSTDMGPTITVYIEEY